MTGFEPSSRCRLLTEVAGKFSSSRTYFIQWSVNDSVVCDRVRPFPLAGTSSMLLIFERAPRTERKSTLNRLATDDPSTNFDAEMALALQAPTDPNGHAPPTTTGAEVRAGGEAAAQMVAIWCAWSL